MPPKFKTINTDPRWPAQHITQGCAGLVSCHFPLGPSQVACAYSPPMMPPSLPMMSPSSRIFTIHKHTPSNWSRLAANTSTLYFAAQNTSEMAWRRGGKIASQAVHDFASQGPKDDAFELLHLTSAADDGAAEHDDIFNDMSALFREASGTTWPGKRAQPISSMPEDLIENMETMAIRSPRRASPQHSRSDTQSPTEYSTPGKWPRARSSADIMPFLSDGPANAMPPSPASVPWTAQPVGTGGFSVSTPHISIPAISPPPDMTMLAPAFPASEYLGPILDDMFFMPTPEECKILRRCMEMVANKKLVGEHDRQMGTGIRAAANMISRGLCKWTQFCINRTWPEDDPSGTITVFMSLADSEPMPGMMRVRWKWLEMTTERGRGETFTKQVARIAQMYGMSNT